MNSPNTSSPKTADPRGFPAGHVRCKLDGFTGSPRPFRGKEPRPLGFRIPEENTEGSDTNSMRRCVANWTAWMTFVAALAVAGPAHADLNRPTCAATLGAAYGPSNPLTNLEYATARIQAAKALREARLGAQKSSNGESSLDSPFTIAVNTAAVYPLNSPDFVAALKSATAFTDAICGGPCPSELDPLVDAVVHRFRDRLHHASRNGRGRRQPISKLVLWKVLGAEAKELEEGSDVGSQDADLPTVVVVTESPELNKLRALQEKHRTDPNVVALVGPDASFPPPRRLDPSALPESEGITSEIKSLLEHPRVTSKHRPQVILFHPEEPEFAGAFGYEHVKEGLAFTWSSHGMPGRAEVRKSANGDEATRLAPKDVAEILMSHPLFASHATVFVNSCYSGVSPRGGGKSLAAEIAHLTGKVALGWMGSVNTKYWDGKNLLWVERNGQRVPPASALVLFHPDGRVEPIHDPQSLFTSIVLID